MIQIPPNRLAPEVLESIIGEFIAREGTDYGAVEVAHDTKVKQLKGQLASGEVVITFDPHTESCNLLSKQAWQLAEAAAPRADD